MQYAVQRSYKTKDGSFKKSLLYKLNAWPSVMEDILNIHHQSAPHHRNRLLLAALLIAGYSLTEAICGFYAQSLTLVSDSGHTAADAIALGLAAFAAWMSSKPSSRKHTYGFGRAEVIAAWVSSLLLIAVIVSILVEAIHRLNHPHNVSGGVVMAVALGGFLVNLGMALLLSAKNAAKQNINIKSSLLHILGDLLGCAIVLISGALTYFTSWRQIDALMSIGICILILLTTVNLLRESLVILMEGVPKHIDIAKVEQAICDIDGVKSVHDIHIWTLTSSAVLLTAHVVVRNLTEWTTIGKQLQLALQKHFAITHATLQPEEEPKKAKS
jgi:cobalt-zinc-cadmium efflux system protein